MKGVTILNALVAFIEEMERLGFKSSQETLGSLWTSFFRSLSPTTKKGELK